METGEKQAQRAQGYVLLATEGATVDKYDVEVGEGNATISIKFIRTNKDERAQIKMIKLYPDEDGKEELLRTVEVEK